MKFLLPMGGVTDFRFAGIMTTPGHKGIPQGIIDGMPWAADNEAYSLGFNPNRFFPWLETMKPYKGNCLFIPLPDVVGNSITTLNQWRNWVVRFWSWPLAFVAQDGQENLPFPDLSTFGTLFIGGSTEWKLSAGATECIKRGQAAGKHIHIGRVNWGKRYRAFRILEGSERFTCDGTRNKHDGTTKTIKDWSLYQAQPNLISL